MQSAFAKLATLLNAKWTGKISFIFVVKQGGLLRVDVHTEESLTTD